MVFTTVHFQTYRIEKNLVHHCKTVSLQTCLPFYMYIFFPISSFYKRIFFIFDDSKKNGAWVKIVFHARSQPLHELQVGCPSDITPIWTDVLRRKSNVFCSRRPCWSWPKQLGGRNICDSWHQRGAAVKERCCQRLLLFLENA